MQSLTKEQIKVLEENDWTIVCESPFEMEFASQFCGTSLCGSTEEAILIYNDIIESKKIREEMAQFRREKQEKKEMEDIRKVKDSVKDILTVGVTEDTLLNFFNRTKDFTDEYGDTFLAEDLQKFFKEAFDEVDPP